MTNKLRIRCEETPALLSRAVRSVLIGTAGWANRPTERDRRASGASHLEHYATVFNTVEINSSFYRSHLRTTYERWCASTPAHFRFSVKAPQRMTHELGLRHCRHELARFLSDISGLGRKLRVVLIQTPGSLEFERRAVARFFEKLIRDCPARLACEPRHPSWFEPRAQALLSELGVSRVVADPARCPAAGEPPPERRLIYYRLHGSPRMYYSAYSSQYLQQLSAHIGSIRSEVWCIFDNTALHASWDNALCLQRLLGAVP